MTYDDLVREIISVTGLTAGDATRVADELFGKGIPSRRAIQYVAMNLGLASQPSADALPKLERSFDDAFGDLLRDLEMESDPAEVIKAVYRECPRCLPGNDDGRVHLPRIGRAPKDSVFHTPEIEQLLATLPEEIRLLIGQINLEGTECTITLYDEANDLDRRIGPIDLTRYDGPAGFERAARILLTRLPRVLHADWN